MKKNDVLKGTVERVDYPNKGIVRVGGVSDTVLVKRVLPGQEIMLRLRKKRRGQWEGELQEVLTPGPGHCDALCARAGDCGGCAYQNLSYDAQLKLKEQQVLRLLERACEEGAQPIPWEGIRPSPSQTGYRNKMEFTFGDEYIGGPLALGLHKRGAFHDIVTADSCRICDEDFGQIVACTRDYFSEAGTPFYHRMRHTGYLRHLLVRKAAATGEILVDLVTASAAHLNDTEGAQPDEKSLLGGYARALKDLESGGRLTGRFTGILHTTNDRLGDVIADEGTEILYGTDHFTDEVLGLSFSISPFSFFQTNTQGAGVLYQLVRDYLGDVTGKYVYDLYSGTGTIAQILAAAADRVTGVEIVPEAVEAAKVNAAANGLDNCRFLCGDVFEVLDQQVKQDEAPDVIVLDPPREGVRPKALNKILSYKAERIVYVSCQITSLVRDLPVFFEHGYHMERVSSVDMFPFTTGIETVACLNRISAT